MSKIIKLDVPLTKKKISSLRAGDEVELSGIIYTARDRAHKKLIDLIFSGKKLPLEIDKAVIYYCGPTFDGYKVTSCGPTTANRMDNFMEPLLKQGLKAVIGKGRRAPMVRELLRKFRSVYFVTYAGCAAYLSQFVGSYRLAAFVELGTESIYEFSVVNFPLIVGIDSCGRDIYDNINNQKAKDRKYTF